MPWYSNAHMGHNAMLDFTESLFGIPGALCDDAQALLCSRGFMIKFNIGPRSRGEQRLGEEWYSTLQIGMGYGYSGDPCHDPGVLPDGSLWVSEQNGTPEDAIRKTLACAFLDLRMPAFAGRLAELAQERIQYAQEQLDNPLAIKALHSSLALAGASPTITTEEPP